METIAQKAGVSISTVSHVINKTRNVNHETREAVLQAMKDLNYRSSKMVNQSSNEPVCIGAILADAREDYYIAMIKAIESVTDDYGISVLFCDSEADAEKEEKNIKLLFNMNVHGLLLAPVNTEYMPDTLKKTSIPVVLIDRQYKQHNFLAVGINNFHSSYLGTKSLFEKGCKRIGFIGYSDPVDTIRQRTMGYNAAVLEYEQNATKRILYLSYNEGDSFPQIKDFILNEQLDGVVCATSTLCYELMAVFDTLDFTTQQNIRIITFDDNRLFDYLKYPVSVISQPVAEIGNAAVENLSQMIEQPFASYNVKRELLFDITIIDR